MDVINFSQQKYEAIKTEATTLLKQLGFKTDKILFVPYSALEGSNAGKKVRQDAMVHTGRRFLRRSTHSQCRRSRLTSR